MHHDEPLWECGYGARCVGGLQIGQVFYLSFTLEDKGDLTLSEKQRVMFPSEISKTFYMRFTLKNLQRYDISFKAPFHLFFSDSILTQTNWDKTMPISGENQVKEWVHIMIHQIP